MNNIERILRLLTIEKDTDFFTPVDLALCQEELDRAENFKRAVYDLNSEYLSLANSIAEQSQGPAHLIRIALSTRKKLVKALQLLSIVAERKLSEDEMTYLKDELGKLWLCTCGQCRSNKDSPEICVYTNMRKPQ